MMGKSSPDGDRVVALAAVPLLALSLLSISPGSADAQLVRVSQTIYGMDCAPCAHAVERRLHALDGSPTVELSLNRGVAELQFESPDHRATLKEIRRSVRESGFSAREARIRAEGTLEPGADSPLLRTPAGEVFVLVESPESPDAIQALEAQSQGDRLGISGKVDADADPEGRWVLQVEGVTG